MENVLQSRSCCRLCSLLVSWVVNVACLGACWGAGQLRLQTWSLLTFEPSAPSRPDVWPAASPHSSEGRPVLKIGRTGSLRSRCRIVKLWGSWGWRRSWSAGPDNALGSGEIRTAISTAPRRLSPAHCLPLAETLSLPTTRSCCSVLGGLEAKPPERVCRPVPLPAPGTGAGKRGRSEAACLPRSSGRCHRDPSAPLSFHRMDAATSPCPSLLSLGCAGPIARKIPGHSKAICLENKPGAEPPRDGPEDFGLIPKLPARPKSHKSGGDSCCFKRPVLSCAGRLSPACSCSGGGTLQWGWGEASREGRDGVT
nr:uncharacterized protein LOC105869208 [Microcebus murinus]